MNKFVFFFGPEKGICVSLISHTNQSPRSRRLALPGNMGPPGLDYMRTKMEGRGIGCECCYWCIICTVILTCVRVFSFIHILMLKCVSVVYCMCVRFPAPLMLVNGEPVGRGQFLKYRHRPLLSILPAGGSNPPSYNLHGQATHCSSWHKSGNIQSRVKRGS